MKETKGVAASENTTKQVLILKGNNCGLVMNEVLRDLSLLSKPNCKVMNRNNDILPFEDVNSLEFLCDKNNCSLFSLATNNKKRPNNLILGRLFDNHVMDMFEFGVRNQQSMSSLSLSADKKAVGSKPLLVFTGSQWDSDRLYGHIQNLLIDFFRGDKIAKISLKGIDHVISFTCLDGIIHMRSFFLKFTKSDSKVPSVVLQPMGPHYDLEVRRSQLPSEDMWKAASRKDKRIIPKKVKNIQRTSIGDKIGRIHMKPQHLDASVGKRISVLRSSGSKRPHTSEGVGSREGASSKRVKKTPAI